MSSSELEGIADKDKAAALMLVNGVDVNTIAEHLKMSPARVQRAAETTLAEIAFDTWDKQQLRRLVTARLETQYRRADARASNATYRDREAAAKLQLAITDRFVKLFGLDADQKLTINHTATTEEISKMVSDMLDKRALPEEMDVLDAEVVYDDETEDDGGARGGALPPPPHRAD